MELHQLGFNVMAWNLEFDEWTYYHFVKSQLFGGCNGHASMELVIPDTPEYRTMLENAEVPLAGSKDAIKDRLVYREGLALSRMKRSEAETGGFPIVQQDDQEEEPGQYVLAKQPCIRIFYSFWGDPNTKSTPLHHRMLPEIYDRECQFEGREVAWSSTAINRLNFIDYEQINKNLYNIQGRISQYSGHLLGVTTLQKPIKHFLHNTGPTADPAILEKLEVIAQKEALKKSMLDAKKPLDRHLQTLLPNNEGQPLSEEAELAEKTRLCAIPGSKAEELLQPLAAFRKQYAEICHDPINIDNQSTYLEMDRLFNQLTHSKEKDQEELQAKGMRFGENPDLLIHFPLWQPGADPEKTVAGFDPKTLLENMLFYATSDYKYRAYSTNCCKIAIKIMKASIPPALSEKLESLNYDLPSENWLVQTPHGTCRFATELARTFDLANANLSQPTFGQRIIQFFQDLWAFILSLFTKPAEEKSQTSSEQMLRLLQKASIDVMEHPERASYQKDKTYLLDKFSAHELELQKDWAALDLFEQQEKAKADAFAAPCRTAQMDANFPAKEIDQKAHTTQHCERLREKLRSRQKEFTLFKDFLQKDQTQEIVAEFKDTWQKTSYDSQCLDNAPR